jgi:hypothetical protein
LLEAKKVVKSLVSVVSGPATKPCVSAKIPGVLEATTDVAATIISVVSGTAAFTVPPDVDGIVTCGEAKLGNDDTGKLVGGNEIAADGVVVVMVAGTGESSVD